MGRVGPCAQGQERVRQILTILAGPARITAVLALFIAIFVLADYLIRNSPVGVQRRRARENAAVVAEVTRIYSANQWQPADDDPFLTLPDVEAEPEVEPDSDECEMLASRDPNFEVPSRDR
jgi:hypothetical protein